MTIKRMGAELVAALEEHEAGRERRTMLATRSAAATTARARTHVLKLLVQYRAVADADAAEGNRDSGLTDEEASDAAGLIGTCFWKRCTDLRQNGMIEQPVDKRTRKGAAGVDRIVCTITDGGRAWLKAHQL